ncbi:hypothetical protein PanWU01x14_304260 [Parasponia andersonii]|uniref:Transmembrane protein n=1 Tax=Parasponia andersonii TaxID=3476 RepID=A0A2P5ASM7_PARAD|nr:hypothetical protein PanWU01x14_304260 [Parasponia andersonii]
MVFNEEKEEVSCMNPFDLRTLLVKILSGNFGLVLLLMALVLVFPPYLIVVVMDFVHGVKKTYGSIPMKLKKICSELEEAYLRDRDVASWKNIRRLEKECDCLFFLEEEYWRQRSRAEWLKAGEKNIKFFHIKESKRRAKNEILGLENDSGV